MSASPKVAIPEIMDIAPYVPGNVDLAPGTKPIILSSNENPFGASPLAMEAFRRSTSTLHRYPDGSCAALRAAIAHTYGLNAARIICSAGSDELIALICQAYAGKGDEILYSQYGFLMYPISALRVGATPVAAPEKDFRTGVENILSAVTKHTRIVFIANPNNPTGSYITEKEMVVLRQKLPQDVLLVIDAAYAEYVTEKDYSAGESLVESTENTVVLHTFSKLYGLAALRLGWGYFPSGVADVIHRVRGPFNVSQPAQDAGIAALDDADFIARSVKHNTQWRSWLRDELTDLGLEVLPSAGNFLLVRFPENTEDAAVAGKRLKEQGIMVRYMKAYGLPDCQRITIGREEENMALVAALKKIRT